ncbi:MAG: Crp/Fnr family transcriptional regulator [Nitrospirae bacterium]|nr:Crp/Fnr family transcriptional regulator [Nitrospirota bacterium]MBF0534049.1 Crp/Fnr family transcriptional regulator [Nitrospirota bacterium]MBF0616208.1 Crp/Fnr family transcriptional regulator [Nitrospirota bacterium]
METNVSYTPTLQRSKLSLYSEAITAIYGQMLSKSHYDEKIINDLRVFPMLSFMDDEDILFLKKSITTKKTNKHKLLLNSMDIQKFMFFVKSGSVKMEIKKSKRIFVFEYISKGMNFFLLNDLKLQLNAVASEASEVFILPVSVYKRVLMSKFDKYGPMFLEELGNKMQNLYLKTEEIVYETLDTRILRLLHDYSEDVDGKFLVKLTHSDIAAFVGTVRVVATRILAKFRDKELISGNDSNNIVVNKAKISCYLSAI